MKSPTLLLVDDDRNTLVTAGRLLESAGFCVEIAHGGRQALAKAKRSSPAVIVMDVLMADGDGLELCTRLRADPVTAHVPLIAYTGVTELRTLSQLHALGICVFAIKPCLPAVIADEAYALLKRVSATPVRVVTGYGELLVSLAEQILRMSARAPRDRAGVMHARRPVPAGQAEQGVDPPHACARQRPVRTAAAKRPPASP